jgi:O-antigen chain-terminating methyltransferase
MQMAEKSVWKADIATNKAEESIDTAENLMQMADTMLHLVDTNLNELKQKVDESQKYVEQAQQDVDKIRKNADDIWHHYHLVVNSNSWKITKPLRVLAHIYRSSKVKLKEQLKRLLIKIKYKLDAYPSVKLKLIRILNHFPAIRARLKRMIITEQISHDNIDSLPHVEEAKQPVPVSQDRTDSSLHIEGPKQFVPDVQTVLNDLTQAINNNKKDT